MQHRNHYEQRHPKLRETGEAEMKNSYEPTVCPYCGSESFIKIGYDSNGIRRYQCKCGKKFKPTTGTIFDSRKISVSEWIEICLNIFRYVSLNAHSGFSRDDLQNYLNLYAFVINPPTDHHEKVEEIIKIVFKNPKSLRYRDQFG